MEHKKFLKYYINMIINYKRCNLSVENLNEYGMIDKIPGRFIVTTVPVFVKSGRVVS